MRDAEVLIDVYFIKSHSYQGPVGSDAEPPNYLSFRLILKILLV